MSSRLRLRAILWVVVLLSIVACAGQRNSAVPAPALTASPAFQTSSITFVVQIPQQTSAHARRPLYVSPSTKWISAAVTPVAGGATTTDGNACQPTQCSITIVAPVGADNFTLNLYDGQNGNLLSTGSTSQTIVAGQLNTVNVSFGGVVAKLALSPATFTFASAVSNSGVLTVSALDADGNTIVAPPTAYSVSISITSGDTTGAVSVSPKTITAPGQTATVSYNGSTGISGPVSITATANGATSSSTSVLLANEYLYFSDDSGTYVAPTAAGQMGNFAEVSSNVGPVAVGPDGTLYQDVDAEVYDEIPFLAPGDVISRFPRPGSAGSARSFSLPSAPQSLAVDGAGNVYVASTQGSTLSVYPPNATGSALPIRQLTTVPFTQIALDQTGALYTVVGAQYGAPQTTAIRVFAPNASGIAFPVRTILPMTGYQFSTIAIDTQNNLYVGGTLSNASVIFVYAPGANGAVPPTRIINTTEAGSGATVITADASGYVFSIYYGFSPTGPIASYGPTAAGNAAPSAFGSAGANCSLCPERGYLAIDNILSPPPAPSGNPTPSATLTAYGNTALSSENSAIGSDQNVWMATGFSGFITKITTGTSPAGPGIVTQYQMQTSPDGGIAAGVDGALWFPSYPSSIGRIDTSGNVTSYPIPTPSEEPMWIAAGPDGNLWFTEKSGVGRITTSGTVTEFAGPTSGALGIVGGPDGNLYVTTPGSVLRVTTQGAISTLASAPSGTQFGQLCVGSDNNLWIVASAGGSPSDDFYPAVVKVTLNGAETTYPLFYGSMIEVDYAWIAPGPEGYLYVSGQGNGLSIVTTGGLDLIDLPTGGSGLIEAPDGNLWFAGSSGIEALHLQ
jgi:hypothetical protein